MMEDFDYKIVGRDYSVLIYARKVGKRAEQFTGSFQLQVNGTFGLVHSLDATSFYPFLKKVGLKPFTEAPLNLKTLSVAISRSHLRLLKSQMDGIANIIIRGEEGIAGKNLVRIELTQITPTADVPDAAILAA